MGERIGKLISIIVPAHGMAEKNRGTLGGDKLNDGTEACIFKIVGCGKTQQAQKGVFPSTTSTLCGRFWPDN